MGLDRPVTNTNKKLISMDTRIGLQPRRKL